MSYKEEPFAVILLGDNPARDDVLIIEESSGYGSVRFRCVLRDDAPGGWGGTAENAILNFAENLEALAAKAREAKDKIQDCPTWTPQESDSRPLLRERNFLLQRSNLMPPFQKWLEKSRQDVIRRWNKNELSYIEAVRELHQLGWSHDAAVRMVECQPLAVRPSPKA